MVLFDQNTEETDSDGKTLSIKGDSEYTLKVSAFLQDDDGNTLGEDIDITFKTINQRRNSLVSMLLMFVLYAGIIGVTIRSARKGQEEQKKEETVNPYKEAKRTGKSVEEIVERENKKKEKAAERAAKEEAKHDEEEDDEPYLEEGHYRVKSARTVQSGGSTYITGRKDSGRREKSP